MRGLTPKAPEAPKNRLHWGSEERFSAAARYTCRPLEISGRHCVRERNALHCHALRSWGNTMAAAERMRAMRERRQASGLRELRLVVPDARSKAIRRRIAKEVAGLDRARELTALGWIEAVSEFDRE